MSKVQIFVGSVMGTALQVAEYVAAQLMQAGHSVRIIPEIKGTELSCQSDQFTLVCTSNTGMGDPPANIQPLLTHLLVDYPPINGCRYGIINLGDSSYPNFAQAGQTFDDALADLGAVRALEPLVIDAIFDDDPLQPVAEWLPKLQEVL